MADCYYELDITVPDDPVTLVMDCPESPVISFVSIPGIQGGIGDVPSGVTFAQYSVPVGAEENNTWWNPITKQIKVFHNSQWDQVAPDGGHF